MTESAHRITFAYGSNMDRAQLMRRCPGARDLGAAELLGYRLEFYGAADLERDEQAATLCVAWSLTPDDERRLDLSEGLHLNPPSYTKVDATAITRDDRVLRGFIYVMTAARRARDERLPNGAYFSLMRNAYLERALDLAPLLAARERAVKGARPSSE